MVARLLTQDGHVDFMVVDTFKIQLQPGIHACNPSYLRSTDKEDCGSKSALGKQFSRPYLKKTHYKKGLVE
jgi:hypothetical protein